MLSLSCTEPAVKPPEKDKGATDTIVLDPSSEGQSILSSYTGSYALLIGESDYTNGWPDLNNIPRELVKVETVLKSQGFKVEKSMNLNASKLEERFKKFVNDYGYKPNNRLLFFYSGHGHTDNGQGFLVPTDAPNPNVDKIGFLQKALVMTDITALARRIRAKHVLFLFDSCFSGSVFKAKELPKVPRQITKLAKEPVRQFITAGSENETVPAKSVFTPAFVDALQFGLGDLTHDGYITGQELGLYLQGEVPEHTDQTPQYGKIRDYELSRGDFVFIVGADAVTKPKPIVPQEKPGNQKPKPVVTVPPKPRHGKVFQDRLKDGSLGPKMVWIKAGSFRMGDIQGGGDSDEKPVHRVSVGAFAIGKYEVTFAEYDKFAEATGRTKPDDEGWGRGNRPVIHVSWNDAVAYTKWLSRQTGKKYRLPTEAEWEYAARAGTETKYWWGNKIGINKANCDGCGSKWDNKKTAPVGSFTGNKFGIDDTVGNVWEWVSDIYSEDYYSNSPYSNPTGPGGGGWRVVRGGSGGSYARGVRAASRDYFDPGDRSSNDQGFRLARQP